jgi:glycosyltransferase involved in cell wall biosynthesis
MSAPLVSILVPVYNRREFLSACLDSALSQTHRDLEIIVIDNASTDGTWDVCREYAARDRRVRIFRNPENIGPVRNWQRCFKEAQGRYGKMLFSDDLMTPDYLEKTLPLMRDPHVAFVFSQAKIGPRPDQSRIAFQFARHSGRFARNRYLRAALLGHRTPVSPGAALFRISDLRGSLRVTIPSHTIDDFEKHGAGIDQLLYLMTAVLRRGCLCGRAAGVFSQARGIDHPLGPGFKDCGRVSPGACLVRGAHGKPNDIGLHAGRRPAAFHEAAAPVASSRPFGGAIPAGGSAELKRMKIGIVTISCNQSKYLAEAIDSVHTADPEQLEYVIVDPGSTDGSRGIIERYRRRFSHIILEPDHGPPDGLNKGFAATGADILGYLNSDDRFSPGALDYVLGYFERIPGSMCSAVRSASSTRTAGPASAAALRTRSIFAGMPTRPASSGSRPHFSAEMRF